MQTKLKTALVVVILSCVIWVLAERAVTQSITVEVDIELEKTGPILLEYVDSDGSIRHGSSRRVTLKVKGPAGLIQQFDEGQLNPLAPRLDAGKVGYRETGDSVPSYYSVSVADLLDDRLAFRETEAFLRIDSAEPEILQVKVTKLLKRSLPIKVYDHSGIELPSGSINISPKAVDTLVPEDRSVEARVDLSSADQMKAAQGPIQVPCWVSFSHRSEEFAVQVKLIEAGSFWTSGEIARPRVGIMLPLSMATKYKVLIEDQDTLREYEPVNIRGTPIACREYRDSRFHLVLEVQEGDQNKDTGARPLRYYIPAGNEFEIVNEVTTPVRFRIEAVNGQ